MRNATEREFNQAIGNARWPSPKRCHAGRCSDAFYKDDEGVRGYIGTEVAQKTSITTRGKVSQVSYLVNPDYLDL
jgi:hypothetical protein